MTNFVPLTPREQAAQAFGRVITDFHQWIAPETEALRHWCNNHIPYGFAKSALQEDVTKYLEELRKNKMGLPFLIFTMQEITAPPPLDQIIGVPWAMKAIFEEDPQKRRVFIRTEPCAYHVQMVFIAKDPDSSNSFCRQFASYLRHNAKRRFEVPYRVADDVLLRNWMMTIFDNTIYPDKCSFDEVNLVGGLIEFDMAGLVPQITEGRGYYFSRDRDSGDPTKHPWYITLQADFYKARPKPPYNFVRANADPDTRIVTETIEPKP